MRTFTILHRLAFAAAAAVLLHACVDSPAAPDAAPGPHPFLIAPVLSLAGPDGAPAKTAAQNQALNDAFQRVNRFRVEVTRGDGSLVLDTIVEVSPGQPEYDFQLPVEATPGETLSVTLTAYEGETELFRSPPVTVEATAPDAAGGGAQAPADIVLSYSGPGAAAASVTLHPESLVLGPNATSNLSASVVDDEGEALPDVPLEWASTAPGIVEVAADGSLRARGEGQAEITVTTPTGLEATTRVYVVRGTLAFVEGGVLKTRPAGGEGVSPQGGAAASSPAWSADGGLLFYVEGGAVRRAARNASLMEGTSPTVSPDGTKLAVERNGRIWLANLDGSGVTEGPAGSTPVWTAPRELVVGGGSIERVGVDGSGRTTLVPGDASGPAVGPGGTVAYVRAGNLHVQGREGPLATNVQGRPTWSPGGMWLAVASDAGIVVVPADGSGPPLPLPGLGSATDPAFQPLGALTAPPALGLSGLDPDPPLPGQEVRILGGGFDDIIPGNNRIFWPTRDGDVEVEVTDVAPDALSTVVPEGPTQGSIRVVSGDREATLAFEPTLGVLEVRARTPWGTVVRGVPISLTDGEGAVVAEGKTGDSGDFVVDGLFPGRYSVSLTAPAGFSLEGAATRSVDLTPDVVRLDVTLIPVPARVEASPSNPTLGVGETVSVSLTAYDVNDQPIERFSGSAWVGGALGRLSVSGSGTEGTLQGRIPSTQPGDASYAVILSGKSFSLGATVRSQISGRLVGANPGGLTVELRSEHGALLQRTTTGPEGLYAFGGLLQGTYEVRPVPGADQTVDPQSTRIVLDDSHPVGEADFTLSTVTEGDTRRPGDIIFFQDYTPWSNKAQSVLGGAPFNFTAGSDFFVVPTSHLLEPIPSTTSVVILSSLSSGGSPLGNVNSPEGQANLDAWVRGGGWLLVHAGDNVAGDGYLVPGLSGKADDALQCPGLKPAVADHPFVRGPDGVLGSADDVTDASADMESNCHANHGALSGILPGDAEVLMVEDDGGRPTYATYPLGSGRVVVTTQTLEFSGHSTRNVINHFWWTLMGDAPPPAVAMPSLRLSPDVQGEKSGVTSDVPVPALPPEGP